MVSKIKMLPHPYLLTTLRTRRFESGEEDALKYEIQVLSELISANKFPYLKLLDLSRIKIQMSQESLETLERALDSAENKPETVKVHIITEFGYVTQFENVCKKLGIHLRYT